MYDSSLHRNALKELVLLASALSLTNVLVFKPRDAINKHPIQHAWQFQAHFQESVGTAWVSSDGLNHMESFTPMSD